MPAADPEQLIHQLAVGDAAAIATIVDASRTSDDPLILVAAALFASDGHDLVARAGGMAASTRDRQLVAIATAHLGGDRDLVDALARDHLVDHPDSVLVAWIAGGEPPKPCTARPDLGQGDVMNRKLTAALLILAAVLANVGFTALGSIFDYPDVLNEPAATVLASFHDHQSAVSGWFLVLALASALMAPIAIGVGRLSVQRAMRFAVPVGVTAAVVQVVGLLRWPILVPGFATDAASSNPSVASSARDSFTTASNVLGTAIGETLGYALTATWTVLVIVALGRRYAGRWFQVLGSVAAALVSVGVLSPLELPGVDAANFLGYVLWSVWLIAFGVVILVHERRAANAPTSIPVSVSA